MKFASAARLAGFGWLVCLCVAAAQPHGARSPARPAALVYSLAGEATVETSAEARRSLRLFDRLVAGSVVRVPTGSKLALAFVNGRRYEMDEGSTARIGRRDLGSRSGPVRPLSPVSPLPGLEAIAVDEPAGLSAGAIRIRSERILGLYPRHGAATLAGGTILRYEPVDGVGKYRVEVMDRKGSVVFSVETAELAVDTGKALRSGMRYDWKVQSIDRVGPTATGRADFVTLSPEIAKSRESLRRSVERDGDGPSLALLAEVDRSLGLWFEAREELRAAVERSPRDSKLSELLAALERAYPD